nr:SPOR domain-containing protein [Parageobacillus thermoglucosidasius]
MPSLLTENLFIDNANDAAKLKSEQRIWPRARYCQSLRLKKANSTPSQSQQKASARKLYRVQVGAFTDPDNAKKLAEELKKKGYPAIIV